MHHLPRGQVLVGADDAVHGRKRPHVHHGLHGAKHELPGRNFVRCCRGWRRGPRVRRVQCWVLPNDIDAFELLPASVKRQPLLSRHDGLDQW